MVGVGFGKVVMIWRHVVCRRLVSLGRAAGVRDRWGRLLFAVVFAVYLRKRREGGYKYSAPRTDDRFPLHDLDLSGQIHFLICMI